MTTAHHSSFDLSKPAFKTVDEQIFPSLHPFGAFYRKQPLLQKRAADNITPCLAEPLNKLRIHDGADQKQPKVINHHSSLYSDELKCSRQGAFENINVENIDFKKVEEEILSFYETFLDANFTNNSQALILFIDALQQQKKLTNQKEEKKIDKENINYQKIIETRKAISDSSTNDGDIEEEVKLFKGKSPAPPLSQSVQMEKIKKKKMLLDPKLPSRYQTWMKKSVRTEGNMHHNKDSLVIEMTKEESTQKQWFDESDGSTDSKQAMMPGFHDNVESQVSMGSEYQAVLQPFEGRKGRRAPKRKVKLVWPVERRNAREIDLLTGKLEKMLNINITNQAKICQLFKEHNLKVKECLEEVSKEKNRFKYELKNKRIVNSTQRRNQEFVFDGY